MLARLSIRDIVLIDRLDIDFASGLSVLTGETGAGKSILLDAFALALGARGDATLVRQGAEQGQVTAMFELPARHPARALLTESDIQPGEALILRRVQFADGRTRAFVNDQPVSVQALQSLGAALVEIHGQHDARALVDAATHRRLLDAYAELDGDAATVERLWDARREAEAAVGGPSRRGRARRARSRLAAPRRLRSWARWRRNPARKPRWRNAAPQMMQGEKVAGDLREAHDAVAGSASPVPTLAAAVRRLERRAAQAPGLLDPAVKAFDAALDRAGRRALPPRAGVAGGRPRSAGAGAHRGAAVRAARRRPQVQCAGR